MTPARRRYLRTTAPAASAAIAFDKLFRHPERSRPTGGVAEGPLLVAEATEQVPPLRLPSASLRAGAALGSGRDDGSFCQMRLPYPLGGEELRRRGGTKTKNPSSTSCNRR